MRIVRRPMRFRNGGDGPDEFFVMTNRRDRILWGPTDTRSKCRNWMKLQKNKAPGIHDSYNVKGTTS